MPAPRNVREFRFDFFRVTCPGVPGYCLLTGLAELHNDHPGVGARNLQAADGFHRIQGWSADNANGAGVFLRLRTTNSATVARISDEGLRDLWLATDEALSEYFCFGYYAEFRTLVLHRNRDAGGSARFEDYLARRGRQPGVSLLPMLTKDALMRLGRMRDVSIMEVGYAVPPNLAVLEKGDPSVDQILNLNRMAGAAHVDVRFSMGHSRSPLHQDLRDLLAKFVKLVGGDTRHARIRGRDPERPDEMMWIDLLEDRIREKVDVPFKGSRPSIEDVQQGIRVAYERRRDEIAEQFEEGS